jgi:hypothetical protein
VSSRTIERELQRNDELNSVCLCHRLTTDATLTAPGADIVQTGKLELDKASVGRQLDAALFMRRFSVAVLY